MHSSSRYIIYFDYLNGHGGLLILVGGEDLGFLCRDDGVSWDQFGHHSSKNEKEEIGAGGSGFFSGDLQRCSL